MAPRDHIVTEGCDYAGRLCSDTALGCPSCSRAGCTDVPKRMTMPCMNAKRARPRCSSNRVMRQSPSVMRQSLLCSRVTKANACYQTQRPRVTGRAIKAVLPKQRVAGSSPVSRSVAKVRGFTRGFAQDRVRTSCVKVHRLLMRQSLLSSDFWRQTPTIESSGQPTGGLY